jgi:hypothetical protein
MAAEERKKKKHEPTLLTPLLLPSPGKLQCVAWFYPLTDAKLADIKEKLLARLRFQTINKQSNKHQK